MFTSFLCTNVQAKSEKCLKSNLFYGFDGSGAIGATEIFFTGAGIAEH
jgi:hypothetical protein